jgi:hypothetical protein
MIIRIAQVAVQSATFATIKEEVSLVIFGFSLSPVSP